MAAIHRLTAADLPRLRQFWKERWDDEFCVAHGTVFHPENVSGFIALDGNDWIGLVTYTFPDTDCEIVSMDSLRENEGIGTALIEKVIEEARANQCRRVHLSTTNDNLRALGFYQKRGFQPVRLARQRDGRNAKTKARNSADRRERNSAAR